MLCNAHARGVKRVTQAGCHVPACPNPPTLHVLIQTEHTRPRAIATCDDHADQARDAGTLRAIHTFADTCAHPDAHWLISLLAHNECVLERPPLSRVRFADTTYYEAVL